MQNKIAKYTKYTALGIAMATSAMLGSAEKAKANDMEKCYGISLAGENDCGDTLGTHSCAGLANADCSYTEWKAVPAGTCHSMKCGDVEQYGKLESEL